MNAIKTIHIGQNIRKIRLLRGMKQEAFAKELGIAQQNVSKMEGKENITDEKVAQAAKVLDVTADFIKNFDEKVVVNNNFLFNDQIINPVKEIIEHFKDEVAKKDLEIERLKAALEDKGKKEANKPQPKTHLRVKEG